jgi:predicted nucleic acid-binding protein
VKAVIDASVMGPLLVPDEVHDRTSEVQALLASGEAIAPQHWPLEIANLCRSAVKRGRLEAAAASARLDDIRRMAVPIDGETVARLWAETIAIALRLDLTPYDAAYIELARRLALPLFSYDRKLCSAAATAGLDLL